MKDHLTVAEVARATGKPKRTTLYQLRKLQRRFPRLLVSSSPPGMTQRKWLVNARLLEQIDRLGQDGAAREMEGRQEAADEQASRIEALEAKLKALRNAHIALKQKIRAKGLTP